VNSLTGRVGRIQSSATMSLLTVTVDSDDFRVIILEGQDETRYRPGEAVRMVFKETEVGLAKGLKGGLSYANRFAGVVARVEKGGLLTKVVFTYRKARLEALVLSETLKAMFLKPGDPVEWLVKMNEISLIRDPLDGHDAVDSHV